MKPLSLRLKGFRGIRDGLARDEIALDLERITAGAQLIALVGSNGRGKTTLMENLTPYPVMPSRAGADGLGSFSYYDHLCLPENEKELIWEHQGQRYRSHQVFWINCRRKTEAYLMVWSDERWTPMRLADGTLSDGKLDTYTRCVEAVLGSAEMFFTSVFSAQGKRQLTGYTNAQIKALLADLLGLEEIRQTGAKAGETAKLLKVGLSVARQELTGLQAEADQIAHSRAALGDVAARTEAGNCAKVAAQAALDDAKQGFTRVQAAREIALQTEARRAQLTGERAAVIEAGKAAIGQFDAQDRREAERLGQRDRRIAERAAAAQAKRHSLARQRATLEGTLQAGEAIERAQRHLPRSQTIVAAREQRLADALRDSERISALQGAERLAKERLAGIEREAGQAALKAQELARRFKLTTEVPCAGTDLQGLCKLLGDAMSAKTLMPSADAQIARLDGERAALLDELNGHRQSMAGLQEVPARIQEAQRKLGRARDRASRLGLSAARQGELGQAKAALALIQAELDALSRLSEGETEEEKRERGAIESVRQSIAAQREEQAKQFRDSLDRIEQILAALPAPFDPAQVQAASQAVERAQQALAQADRAFLGAVRDQQVVFEADKRATQLQEQVRTTQQRIGQIEAHLGGWTLLAKGLSNDGVIALAIDDAGPTLAGLANDLLLACYGPRFTVSIKTLVETAKGEAREGFDILVHDADSGQSKSVALMSGGERVWVCECLTRAIALYLAQNAGPRYAVLFSDEADGPLDPERKRMFMAMKREVLRLGGYEQEFFVSQTPELTAMADAIIDLDAMQATPVV